ncbi:efflux RND transporter periplasmic adaptor subunit [Streptomyces endophyticus]|uniref:Peptidoglycan-binding protein n=1 Tax=Streptomyces endophyticus TaxID=714166 RepID=A0ABU6FJ97_9ACTN|nr:peptidoglycan-binding protein [Streptomyces endophyticus]MEB8344123.1 peptidoglycan-binding protein [Streptomyces endophyticus]
MSQPAQHARRLTPEEPLVAADRGLSRKRKWVAVVAAAAVLLTGAGIAASFVVKSPAQAAADAKAPAEAVLTAPVEKRVLKDSVILRGTVVAGQTVDVSPAGGGTEGTTGSVVTKAPKPVGTRIRAGQVLTEISGRPVFALKGKVPVYRDLKPGSKGADVAQLQGALAGLGHATGSDTEGTFGAGTKSALAAFYASIGYSPVSAQSDGAATVQSAQDAVTEADRAWEDAKDARDKHADDETRKAVDRAAEDLARARSRLERAQVAAGPMLPASEVVYLSGFPARVDSVNAVLGSTATGKVMTVSAGRLAVDGYLQESQKGLVRAGQKVEIRAEATGFTTTASVRSVADTMAAAQDGAGTQGATGTDAGSGEGAGSGSGSGSGGDSAAQGYLMVVTADKTLPGDTVGQDVRLTVEAASTKGKALVVPVTAISSAGDGSTVVTVRQKGGTQRRVEVRTGTSGDGFVAVTPAAGERLAEGDEVVTGVKQAATGAGR